MTTGSTIARFTITLSKSVAESVQVAWNTKDGTAKAGIDYAAASGTAVFSPGETNKDVDVLVYGRAVGTEDRNFFLEMTPPPNAILGESIGECIIYLDTAGNTAVIQVIVPTGPQGAKGDSAYQSWLNLGNTGTEQDFIDSLSPLVEEIAAEVAPILDISSSPLTAEGTETLSKPDTMTGKRLARRVAYVGAAKVATVVLAGGDNLITHADLSGDAVDFNSIGLYPRILRGTAVISPEWSVEQGDKLLIKSAVAGDALHVCQYDVISERAVRNAPVGSQAFEALRRSYAEAGYALLGGFSNIGLVVNTAADVVLWEPTGVAYAYSGALRHTIGDGETPIGNPQWVAKAGSLLRLNLASTGGAAKVGTSDGRTVEQRLAALPNEVDASGTAAMLVAAHNADASAHPQLSSFITAEADRAEQAADAASLSGDVYPDTASGLASTTNGQYFSVVSPVAEGYLDLYRNNAGLAAFQKTYPSSALVERLDNGFNKLTGNSGFSMDGSDGQSVIEVEKGDAKALVIGTYDDEVMTFDTLNNKVIHKSSELVEATVSKFIRTSDTDESDSEYTEELINSNAAKVVGNAHHNLRFDTVNGELISTFKIVDNSQNNYTVFDNDIPSVVTGIPPEYAKANRLYQAIPTIVKTGDRFWLSWRADVITRGEGCGNFFVIGYSDDNCQTVTETHVIRFYNLDHQLIDTMLWVNPETGEVWIFWSSSSKALQMDGMLGCWCSVLENPNAATGFSWSTPTRFHNVGHPRRPVRINGAWVQCIDNFAHDAMYLPIYPETTGCTFFNFDPRTKSVTSIGRNSPNYINGKYTGFFETEVVQLIDGRLLSTTRGPSGSELTRSFSSDGGKTWTAQEEYTSLYPVSSSRCWLGRTPYGRLIMTYNNDLVRRTLTVKLSDDEGETWPYSVVLEPEDSPQAASYPVIAFNGDDIYVAYDYGRGSTNQIRVAIVKESEIVSGSSVPVINIISNPFA